MSTQLKTFNSVMQEITCKLTPTVLQKKCTMQTQVRRPRVAYADHQKAACLCSLLKRTRRYRAARPRLSAAGESTPIQALFRKQQPVAHHDTSPYNIQFFQLQDCLVPEIICG